MNPKELRKILNQNLQFNFITVNGFNGHFEIIIVDTKFDGMNKINRHKMIYAPLMEYISNNQIHALKIKAYTPKEAKERHVI